MSIQKAIDQFNFQSKNPTALLRNWRRRYASEIAVTLPVMTKKERQKQELLQKRIKELEKQLEGEMASLQKRINGLQDKFADDLINSTDYHEMKNRYEREIEQLKVQQTKAKVNSKDIQEMMQNALSLMENIEYLYDSASLEDKQALIGSIFTGNLYFEDNRVRTTEVNKVIEMVCNNKQQSCK